MKTLRLKKGTVFYRVETKEKRKHDNPKFYSYFREDICNKKTWVARCENYCRYMEVQALRDLKLIVVPYKTVLYLEDVTKDDEILAKTFMKLARRVYKGNPEKIKCVKEAVADLILLRSANPLNCPGLLADWTLSSLICKAGFDGMVRFVEGSVTNCYDEVAICSPDEKVKIVHEEMIKLN